MKIKHRFLEKFKNQNTRSIIKNIIGSCGVKGFSLIIGLFTTPVYIRYFNNNEILGIWFTLLSVLSWILYCDMGIGNGLRNKLVIVMKNEDSTEAKKYISSCYGFSLFIAFIIVVIALIVSCFINWNMIFNISKDIIDANTLSIALGILLMSIFLQLILRLITSILYALQKAFIPGFLNLSTNVIMLLYALIATKIGMNGNIIHMAIAYFIAVNIPLVIATIFVFFISNRELRPQIKYFEKKYAVSTLKIGGVFLWLQLMAMILNSTNSYFVTIFVSNAAVVDFNIYNKIFSLIGTFVTLISTPIWSATTKAQVEKNYKWLYELFKKFAFLSILAILADFSLVPILQIIFNIWLKENTITVNYGIALLFALFGSMLIWSSTITCFVNGLGELKLQSIFLTLGAIIDIVATYFLSKELNSFVAIVIANILAYAPYLIVQTIWLVKYLKKHVKNECENI